MSTIRDKAVTELLKDYELVKVATAKRLLYLENKANERVARIAEVFAKLEKATTNRELNDIENSVSFLERN